MKPRIISASRRTDIPAFYGEWFMNRVAKGWFAVPNPLNSKQVSRVECDPKDTLFVFWTRWAAPFMKHLDKLEQSYGDRFYFQYTLIDYPPAIDPRSPRGDKAVRAFRRLSDHIGPERVVWRYDPIVFSPATDPDFHRKNFKRLAERLNGVTKKVVISIVDPYKKALRRLDQLGREHPEYRYRSYDPKKDGPLIETLAEIAGANGMDIQSCAEEFPPNTNTTTQNRAEETKLSAFGIKPGKCIDDDLIRRLCKLDPGSAKDKAQRPLCGCIRSREIGMYDSCVFGCAYCYATNSFDAARRHHADHNPLSESVIGNYKAPPAKLKVVSEPIQGEPVQGSLF